MSGQFRSSVLLMQFLLQRAAFALVLVAALASVTVTTLAAIGLLPWLQFSAVYGDVTYDNAGMIAQISLTMLALTLVFFLPAARRMMALETSHRTFNLQMHDVAQAYVAAHAADRQQIFQLSSEFDSVRERLAYLRDHPDLGSLEPAVLEVAAQMSHISKELAEVYSDEKVRRARDFLSMRQQEVEQFNERLEIAKQTGRELTHWLHEVELEESVAASQLNRLREELHDVLPEIAPEYGYQETYTVLPAVEDDHFEPVENSAQNVVGITKKAAE
jgi:hypothetical protein